MAFEQRVGGESVVLGVSLLGGGGVSSAVLAAIFISNVPEGPSSAAGMKQAQRSAGYVFGVRGGIAVASGLASLVGCLALDGVSPAVIALVTAIAAGAILAMLADTTIPEAFERAHVFTGLITAVGFLTALAVHLAGECASLIPPGIVVPTMPNPPGSERRRIGNLVRVDGHDVHVRQDGPEDAPAVVLVHGFSCSMHWFDRVAADLAAEHRVIRVDLLGHGCTSAATQLDAGAQARAMSGVLERLGTKGATAVGHSFGADVVLAMARRTDQVARVVVMGQAPDYDCSRLPSIAFLPALPALATLTHRLTPPWMARISSRVGFGPGHHDDHGPDDPQRIALDRAAMNPRMYRTILADRRARLAALPLDVQVRDLGLPVLAILGGRDRLYPSTPTAARYRAAGARVVVIDDAGHSVNVQRPAEVAELIRDFAAHPTPG